MEESGTNANVGAWRRVSSLVVGAGWSYEQLNFKAAIQQAAKAAIFVAFFSDSSPSPIFSDEVGEGSWDGCADHTPSSVPYRTFDREANIDSPATPRFPATKVSKALVQFRLFDCPKSLHPTSVVRGDSVILSISFVCPLMMRKGNLKIWDKKCSTEHRVQITIPHHLPITIDLCWHWFPPTILKWKATCIRGNKRQRVLLTTQYFLSAIQCPCLLNDCLNHIPAWMKWKAEQWAISVEGNQPWFLIRRAQRVVENGYYSGYVQKFRGKFLWFGFCLEI